jgi:hypothetical protein
VSPRPVLPSLDLCQSNMTPTVSRFRADMQETSTTVVHVSFTAPGFGSSSIHSKFLARCVIGGKGRAPGWRARPGSRARPKLPDRFGKGAPLLIRARPKESGIVENLLIQHTVSRWCSSGCVHRGCGGVDCWLQTKY